MESLVRIMGPYDLIKDHRSMVSCELNHLPLTFCFKLHTKRKQYVESNKYKMFYVAREIREYKSSQTSVLCECSKILLQLKPQPPNHINYLFFE